MLPLWQWPCSSLERRRHMAELDKAALEALVRQVLLEKLGAAAGCGRGHGVRSVAVPAIQVTERDRLDTGRSGDRVWTKDLFSLAEAPGWAAASW